MLFSALLLAAQLGAQGPAAPLLEQAVAAFMDADFARAEALSAEAARVAPEDPSVPFYSASGCWWQELAKDFDADGSACADQIEAAVTRAEQHVEREPRDAWGHYYLGRAYSLRARLKAFQKSLRAASGDMRRAHEALTRAEELEPKLRAQSVELGFYNYVAGRLPTLGKILRVLMFLPGGDIQEGLDRLALVARSGGLGADEALLYLAIIEIRYEGKLESGLDRLRELQTRFPHNPFLANYLAQTLRRNLHQPREAMKVYAAAQASALHETAGERDARLGVALCLADVNDLDSARALLEPLVAKHDYVGAEALAGLVSVSVATGDMAAAHRAYRELGQRSGETAERFRRKALEALNRVPAPEDLAFVAAYAEGLEARRAGRVHAAERAYVRALELRPRSPRTILELAEIAFAGGRSERATRLYTDLAGRGDAPEEIRGQALLRLGQLADARGQRAEALAFYARIGQRLGLFDLKEQAGRLVRQAGAVPDPGPRADQGPGR